MSAYYISVITYKFYFHPLANFPGPFFAAISDVWYVRLFIGGDLPWTMERMHQRYGDVVRVAPNELSFATPDAFHDIHSHAARDRKPFLKSSFYQAYERPRNIISMRDPQEHAARRKMYAGAFSTRALRGQTEVITPYVDLFVAQLTRLAIDEPVDMRQWLNWLTFDIFGDLTFGTRMETCSQ